MKEILFRGKRIDNGEWVYGLPYSSCYDNEIDQIVENDCHVDIHQKTVSQYTGLKDKNGVKIFEGDILLNEWGEVKYDDGAFRFSNKNCYMVLTQYMCEFRNVIGNIHDK